MITVLDGDENQHDFFRRFMVLSRFYHVKPVTIDRQFVCQLQITDEACLIDS